MGLSRRQFTKEFKLAAVRRLEQGVSIRGSGTCAGGRPQRYAAMAAGVPLQACSGCRCREAGRYHPRRRRAVWRAEVSFLRTD